MLHYVGSIGVSDLVPGIRQLTAALSLVTAPLYALKARLAAQIGVLAKVSLQLPDVSAVIRAASVSVSIPSLTVGIGKLPSANIQVAADLNAQLGVVDTAIGSINAAVSIGALGLSGVVTEYTWDGGTAAQMGDAIASQLATGLPGGANGNVYAVLIATEDPAAWASLTTLLKTTP